MVIGIGCNYWFPIVVVFLLWKYQDCSGNAFYTWLSLKNNILVVVGFHLRDLNSMDGFHLRDLNSMDGLLEFLKLTRIVIRKRWAENMDQEQKHELWRIQEWESELESLNKRCFWCCVSSLPLLAYRGKVVTVTPLCWTQKAERGQLWMEKIRTTVLTQFKYAYFENLR